MIEMSFMYHLPVHFQQWVFGTQNLMLTFRLKGNNKLQNEYAKLLMIFAFDQTELAYMKYTPEMHQKIINFVHADLLSFN